MRKAVLVQTKARIIYFYAVRRDIHTDRIQHTIDESVGGMCLVVDGSRHILDRLPILH